MEALLIQISRRLPMPLRAWLDTGRLAALSQFLRFGLVGTLGFVVDTATVYATRSTLGLYWGGAAAYVVAATTTWLANRLWTFRSTSRASPLRQWMLFLAANALGFVLNRGTYALLVSVWDIAWKQPIVAVAAGSIAGMVLNFHLSRRIVFR